MIHTNDLFNDANKDQTDYQQDCHDRPGYRHESCGMIVDTIVGKIVGKIVGCKSVPLLRFGSKRLPEVKFDNYQTYNRH